MSPSIKRQRRAPYTTTVNIAVEIALSNLMLELEGIKAYYRMTDDQVAAAVAVSPGINEFWREWRRRQEPLTEQIPVVEESIGDIHDL